MPNKIKWIIVEEHYDAHPFPFYIHMDLISTSYPEIIGTGFKNTILLCENNLMLQVFDESEFSRIGLHALDRLMNQPGFGLKVRRNARIGLEKLERTVDLILRTDLSHLSNLQLSKLMESYVLAFRKSSVWGTIISFIEYENFYGSKKIKEFIADHAGNSKVDPADAFEALSSWPEKTFVLREKEELLRIAERYPALAGTSRIPRPLKEALAEHAARFGWLAYSYQGPLLNEGYFEMELRELRFAGYSYAKFKAEETRRNAKRRICLKALNFSRKERELTDALAELFFLKALRRDMDFKSNFALSFVFRELSRRRGLSVNQSRFMLAEEIIGALRGGPINFRELQARTKCFAYYFNSGLLRVLSGDRALLLKRLLPGKKVLDLKKFAGEVASIGKARGRVKVVRGKSDYSKFKKGDVLVAISTNPNMVPLMKKAAAIITETGGITSHAAIVSRELGVPCVIGTRIATSVLKDGDLVEVDARKGVVRKISKGGK